MSENVFSGWEDATTTEDFFSDLDQETVEQDSTKEVIEEITKEEEVESKGETSVKDEDLFGSFDEEDDKDIERVDDDEEDEDEVEAKSSGTVSVLNTLKEKGLLDFELEEGEELTEELAEDLLEDKFEETIEERIKDKIGDLPEDVKLFMQFALKGGSLSEFIQQTGVGNSGTTLTEGMDLEDEKSQETIVRQILEEEGNDQETIETQVELLKDSDRLKTFAERKYNKWLTDVKAEKEELVKKQELQQRQLKEKIKEDKKRVNAILEEENIGGLTPTKNDVKTLASFLNDRSVKLQNGVTITELQKELYYEIPKNEKAMIQLALLVKNRNADGTFNFENLVKEAETKVTREIKKNIRRNKTAIPNSVNGKNKGGKTLADYFNN